MRNGKKALLMITGSLCAAAAMMLWPAKPVLEVQTAVIAQGELVRSVRLMGKVGYAQEMPYISLKEGVVRSVYAKAGEPVREGELLFSLDTSAEEKALAELYQAQFEQHSAADPVQTALLSIGTAADWRQQETMLRAAIEVSQIRAAADGTMGGVFVREGSIVAAAAPLGTSHGERLAISALMTNGYESLSPGMAAVIHQGKKQIPLVLKEMSLTDGPTAVVQFEAAEPAALEAFQPGETVELEVVVAVKQTQALIPLQALTGDETLWVVRDGKAIRQDFELGHCNRLYAEADESWRGERVILLPENYDLKDGTPVRVIP